MALLRIKHNFLRQLKKITGINSAQTEGPMAEDEWLNDQIYAKAKNPSAWLQQAEYLLAAGKAIIQKNQDVHELIENEVDIKKKFDIMRQFDPEAWMIFSGVMLWGFALENLAKGVLVSRDKNIISRDNEGDIKIKGIKKHDIRKLANKCGLSLNDDSRELLNFLSRVTVWGGRYPAPFGSSYKQLSMEWNGDKQRLFVDLYNELHNLLELEVEKHNEESKKRKLAEEKKEYGRLLNELRDLKKSQMDGVVLYSVKRKLPTEELAAISCAVCHAQFSVGQKVRAAMCRCGTLYYSKYMYDNAKKKVAQNIINLPKPK